MSPGGAVEVAERTSRVNVNDRDDDEGRHNATVRLDQDAEKPVAAGCDELSHDQLSMAKR
jgi:hypothetical protein